MKHCIICREHKNDFSDEHVIPKSLGGHYLINTVCKGCNSKLGSTVDSNLINHKFSEFQRSILQLKGQSKKIPNPFTGTHSISEIPDQKIQIKIDEKMKLSPCFIPNVTLNKRDGIIESVNIVVDAKDEDELDNIIKKLAKRIGIPYERLSKGEKKVHSIPHPEIQTTLSIDLHDFKLGLLKIAYEFAVDTIPKYYNDPMAIDISHILSTSSHDRSTEYVKIGSGFHNEIMYPFQHILDLESKKHYLVLIQAKSQLLCFIKLHKLFTIGVILSNQRYLIDNIIVGVNDIENKNFRKFDTIELINRTHGQPEIVFQYWFPDQESANKFATLEKDPKFDFYRTIDGVPLFNKDGSYTGKTVEQECNNLLDSFSVPDKTNLGDICGNFKMDKEKYIKIIPSNELLCVSQVQIKRKQISKL